MTMKRITITLDTDLDRKIRSLQAQLIASTQKGWSYSKVLTSLVGEGLESSNIKKMKPKIRTS